MGRRGVSFRAIQEIATPNVEFLELNLKRNRWDTYDRIYKT